MRISSPVLQMTLVTLLLLTNPAYATDINFDDLNSRGSQFGVSVEDHYKSLGVIFDVGYASDYWYTNGVESETSIPTIVYGEAECGNNWVDAVPVSAHFVVPGTTKSAPVSLIALTVPWTDRDNTVWLYGYDHFGTVVATNTKSRSLSPLRLSISGTNIYSFKVVFAQFDDIDGIDDLSFEFQPVPEPSTILALLSGISGLGIASLKRRIHIS